VPAGVARKKTAFTRKAVGVLSVNKQRNQDDDRDWDTEEKQQ